MYSCYLLSESSRNLLLERFPPKYPKVICQHVTVLFGSNALPDKSEDILVTGYIDNGEGLECLLVTVNGNSERPDGKVFHITHSLNSELGYKPVDSNTLIKNAENIVRFKPIKIDATPEIL